jgi:Predicted transcriptional regulator with C-terminal CBS domains
MNKFTPDFDHIQQDASITDASIFARKMLVEFVKQSATERGITQAEIATLTGLKQSNIARVLSGKYSPTLDTFLKIAGALDMHIDISRRGRGDLRD